MVNERLRRGDHKGRPLPEHFRCCVIRVLQLDSIMPVVIGCAARGVKQPAMLPMPPTQTETTKFWRDPALGNLELLHATYFTHAFAPHSHEGFAIGVIEKGSEKFDYRHRHFIAPAGSIVVINPGEPHTGQAASQQGWSYRMLYPTAQLLQRAASQLVSRPQDVPFFRLPVIHDPALAKRILTLHTTLEESLSTLERETYFLGAFAELIAHHADNRPTPHPLRADWRRVRLVREYLDAHFAEDVSLEQLAHLAAVSPFHLLRIFRRDVGLTPHAYFTQVRVSQAKSLLLSGLPITQVALDTGFSDQSHFTKRFKQIMGVTPGQYRSLSQPKQFPRKRNNLQDSQPNLS